MSRTAVSVQAEIDDVHSAITALVKGGQSYTISSGGSTRTVTQLDMESLRSWLAELYKELALLNDSYDTPGLTIGANW